MINFEKEVIGTENGLPYLIKVSDQTETNIDIDVYYENESVGNYGLLEWTRAFGEYELFVDLSKYEDYEKVWTSNIFVYPEHRQQGISRNLCEGLVTILQNVGGVHVVTFTELGKERMKKNFIERGYERVQLNGNPVPEGFASNRWLAKQH